MPLPNPSNRPFQNTRWSLVLKLNNGADEKQARKALEELCGIYWPPLYSYARRYGLRPADAEDATQSFFCHALEKNFFAEADASRGRMRSYLLSSFQKHIINMHHAGNTLKRGGGYRFVPMDAGVAETLHLANDLIQSTPEAEFDKRWALTMLETVIKKLENEYLASGCSAIFAALLPYISLGDMDPMPVDIGLGIGLSPTAVRKAGSRLRKRFGDEVKDMIRHTLADPTNAAVLAELEALKRALRGK